MRKILTPCNIAIVIALGCFSYVVVQNHYDRETTREFYRTVMEMNSRAMTTATNAQTTLNNLPTPVEDTETASTETRTLKAVRIAKTKRLTFRKRKPNPCEEVTRTTTIGQWEIAYKDLRCLNAANFKEQ